MPRKSLCSTRSRSASRTCNSSSEASLIWLQSSVASPVSKRWLMAEQVGFICKARWQDNYVHRLFAFVFDGHPFNERSKGQSTSPYHVVGTRTAQAPPQHIIHPPVPTRVTGYASVSGCVDLCIVISYVPICWVKSC